MELFQILAEIDTNTICDTLRPIIDIIKSVLTIIKIGIPIILILMGTIDLGKAVLASDDKAIKESTSKLVKRIIAAVAVFFVATIVELIMTILSKSEVGGAGSWMSCWEEKENETEDN